MAAGGSCTRLLGTLVLGPHVGLCGLCARSGLAAAKGPTSLSPLTRGVLQTEHAHGASLPGHGVALCRLSAASPQGLP